MKRKPFLIGIIFTLLISFSYAACEDFDYSVTYIGKDDIGCFDGLQIIIENPSCQSSCFSEFDNITLSTDIENIITISPTDSISSPLIIVKQNFNCSNGIPTKFFADLNGPESCNFIFDLGEEFEKKTIYDKEKECRTLDKVYNATSDSCVDKPEENEDDIEVIESPRVEGEEEIENNNEGGSPGGSGGGLGGGIPSEDTTSEDQNQNTQDSIQIQNSDSSGSRINLDSQGNQPQNLIRDSSNNTKESDKSPINYLVYIAIILVGILLIQGIIIFFVKKRPKKKIRKF